MKILYEDDQIVVCYKEAGLPVQSARVGTKDMVSMLKNYLWEKGGCRKEPYLGVIHRLDQPVEGVVVFAKTAKAAASLSEQIRTGKMKKTYQAAVCLTKAEPVQEETLIHYLLKDSRTNTSKIVPEGTKDAKRAELSYRILRELEDGEGLDEDKGTVSCGKLDGSEELGGSMKLQGSKGAMGNEGADGSKAPGSSVKMSSASEVQNDNTTHRALVEIHLKTGRHHQIRVQMAGAGMPLLGDQKYGMTLQEVTNMKSKRKQKAAMQGEPQETTKDAMQGTSKGLAMTSTKQSMREHTKETLALCAVSLQFQHPKTGEMVEFSCTPQGRYLKCN